MFGLVSGCSEAVLEGLNAMDQDFKGMHEFPVIAFEPLDSFQQLAGGFLR